MPAWLDAYSVKPSNALHRFHTLSAAAQTRYRFPYGFDRPVSPWGLLPGTHEFQMKATPPFFMDQPATSEPIILSADNSRPPSGCLTRSLNSPRAGSGWPPCAPGARRARQWLSIQSRIFQPPIRPDPPIAPAAPTPVSPPQFGGGNDPAGLPGVPCGPSFCRIRRATKGPAPSSSIEP